MTVAELEFAKYVTQYQKSYVKKEDYKERLEIFAENLRRVNEHNEKNGQTFTVGINKFSDWTKKEYKKLLGYSPLSGAV